MARLAGLLLAAAALLGAARALPAPGGRHLLQAAAPPAAEAAGAATFQGSVSIAFSEYVEDSESRACGVRLSGNYLQHAAGLSLAAHPGACGRCVVVRCAAAACADANATSVNAAVVDDCPGCGPGDLRLNSFAWRSASGQAADAGASFPASWDWAPCDLGGSVVVPPAAEEQAEPVVKKAAGPAMPPSQLAPAPEEPPAPSVPGPLPVVAPAPEPVLLPSLAPIPEPESARAALAAPLPDTLAAPPAPELTTATLLLPRQPAPTPAPEMEAAAAPSPEPQPNLSLPAAALLLDAPAPAPEAVEATAPELYPSFPAPLAATAAPPAPEERNPFLPQQPAIAPAPQPEPALLPAIPKAAELLPAAAPPADQAVAVPAALASPEAAPAPAPEAEPALQLAPSAEPAAPTIRGWAHAAYWHPVGFDQFRRFACGLTGVSSPFQARFAGIALDAHATGDYAGACGRCIRAACADPAVCGPGAKPVVLQVLDDCSGCGPGALNLPPVAFAELAGHETHALPAFPVEWAFVPCGALITGDIYLQLTDGGNAWWQGFTFGNANEPLAAATLNGQDLLYSPSSHRWELEDGGARLNLTAPLELELTAADSGTTLTATLASLVSQPLTGVQFPLQAARAPATPAPAAEGPQAQAA